MNGFLIADKPRGITSSDMVLFVRKRLPRGTSVGHGGTLDPDACGVLPICVGAATRLFDYIIDKQKIYEAQLQLGSVTDTQDATGEVLETRPVMATRADIEVVLPRFTGDILQVPPMYSAVKRNGERLYKLARRGETIEVEPRACHVDSVELLDGSGENRYGLRVVCRKGVYIRTLCHDIGAALGCGAHMAALERVQAGVFTKENALSREEIDLRAKEGTLADCLLPMDAPLAHLPRVDVSETRAHAVLNGNVLKAEWLSAPAPRADAIRVYLSGRFAGIAQAQADGSLRCRALLLSREVYYADSQK